MKKLALSLFILTQLPLFAADSSGKYAQVNGIKMYCEIHGAGFPLVLLHGGGSSIDTTFGRILPELAKTHQVIAVDLQAHGRTGDRKAPETFKQDAADVAELLRQLKIKKADVFGFSNGGQTAMQLALDRPEFVHKLVLASTFYKREGVPASFWEWMANGKFEDMPQVYKDHFLKIRNDPKALRNMHDKDLARMQNFKDWTDEQIKTIQAPALVALGDQDLPTYEHAVEMARNIPHSRLAIIPGNHGSYLGEIMSPDPSSKMPLLFVEVVNEFLAAK